MAQSNCKGIHSVIEYTPFQKQCIQHNLANTTVGSKLLTLKGSKIERDLKLGLGKRMCNKLYFHKMYVHRVLTDIDAYCLYQIANSIVIFEYNLIRWDHNSKEILLEECPDFDTSREPVVGNILAVTQDTVRFSAHPHKQILHHKWTMVDNDYSGFDVSESWNWSKQWLSVLTEKADGSSQEAWEAQLNRFNFSCLN